MLSYRVHFFFFYLIISTPTVNICQSPLGRMPASYTEPLPAMSIIIIIIYYTFNDPKTLTKVNTEGLTWINKQTKEANNHM